MIVKEIPINDIDISEFNTRKNLSDGQEDSTIDDLAKSIEKQGLLSPITVYQQPNGRFALVAGQRRFNACRHLGWQKIPAIIRDSMTEADATAVSLIENVRRADMNPRDKALAFKSLIDKFGDIQSVSRETWVGLVTVPKYIQLLDLASELQEQLVAGEVKNTGALAKLAQKFSNQEDQIQVWKKIKGFNQDEQQEIIKHVYSDLENLDEIVDKAHEGAFQSHIVRNCPFDCPTIPHPLKKQISIMIESFENEQLN